MDFVVFKDFNTGEIKLVDDANIGSTPFVMSRNWNDIGIVKLPLYDIHGDEILEESHESAN